ncbi:hypothetical protein Pint_06758 [Pistacia integerrima]|uniref:Uncharacterized protein n=1 Tax=Pistacia integerrima TaxID=434235 RepID=A0ACC0XWJ6_9ROSI|nr:hypothetical protein Pint_06758 [Pistacia integerrima]
MNGFVYLMFSCSLDYVYRISAFSFFSESSVDTLMNGELYAYLASRI